MLSIDQPLKRTVTLSWSQGVSRYQWLVLFVAWLGWVFDSMDATIYALVLHPALEDLLHVPHAVVGFGDGLDARPEFASFGNEVVVRIDHKKCSNVFMVFDFRHRASNLCRLAWMRASAMSGAV